MGEAQPGSVSVYRRHDWDFEAWIAGAENFSPLKCTRCGFEPRTGRIGVPADRTCDMSLEETYFDFSDHVPGCEFFSGPSCPVDAADVIRELAEQERAFAAQNRENGHDRIAELQERSATQLEHRADELTE